MVENEAIKSLEYAKRIIGLPEQGEKWSANRETIAIDIAIKSIEEIQQYRAIGTVEECREARERQIPKKPIMHKDTNRADCPICGATVRGIKEPFGDWCSKCGQKLDWSDTD